MTSVNPTAKSSFLSTAAAIKGGDSQQRRIRGDGTFNYQEIVSRPATTATLLRLARRGDVIYQIFQLFPIRPLKFSEP